MGRDGTGLQRLPSENLSDGREQGDTWNKTGFVKTKLFIGLIKNYIGVNIYVRNQMKQ